MDFAKSFFIIKVFIQETTFTFEVQELMFIQSGCPFATNWWLQPFDSANIAIITAKVRQFIGNLYEYQLSLSIQADLPNLFFHNVSTLMASLSLTSNGNVWSIDQTRLRLA